MKRFASVLCLLLALTMLFSACVSETPPADTDSNAVSDFTEGTEPDTSADTEDPVPVFDPASDPRKGTAVNIDCDAVWYLANAHSMNLDNLEQKCVDWFNKRYKDCGVSDILYNIDRAVPSESREEWIDFYAASLKNNTNLDETTEKHGRVYYEVYEQQKIDPYSIWIGLCRENGINPWLSFRMNDVHAPNLGYSCSDMYYTAKENGWLIGAEAGYGSWAQHCLDYSRPEVREYYIVYIDEMLGKYDVFGIELDFLREITCFKTTTEDNCRYMDLFMEELNGVVEKYEAQYGHEIRIMLRVSRDIDQVKVFGFDILSWAQKDWLDVVVPASAYGITDSDMPISGWKEALKGTEVQVYAGIEGHVQSGAYLQTQTTLAGFTSMYLHQGADKIYLYNLFNSGNDLFKICSSMDAADRALKRSYVVTEQNVKPNVRAVDCFKPLPVIVNRVEEVKPVPIRHGRLNAKWDTYIYIGITNKKQNKVEEANFSVYYNGVACEYMGAAFKAFADGAEEYRCILSFKIPKEAWQNSEFGEISFSADSTVIVKYVELMNGLRTVG